MGDELRLSPTVLGRMFLNHFGYGTWDDLGDGLYDWFGAEAGDRYRDAMAEHATQDATRRAGVVGTDYAAAPALCAIPTPLFLDLIESAVDHALVEYRLQAGLRTFTHELIRLFELRGVQFRFNDHGRLVWHGDEGAYQTVVAPVLDVLRDARLAGASSEFHAAIGHLRRGTSKELEDAIDEAAKAVESTMKVALDTLGVTYDADKDAASKLWMTLRDGGHLETYSEWLILAASRIRNRQGGHGAGATPRTIDIQDAEGAVRSSAAAIMYIAAILPAAST